MRDNDEYRDVRECQEKLTAHGFPCGTIDGIFGPKADKAARAFQQARSLTVDGIVGKNTWAALDEAPKTPVQPDPEPPKKDEPDKDGGKPSILGFLRWAMGHASPARIPAGSTLCIPPGEVGIDGKWEYLYGTTGHKCTQALLDKKYNQYYKGWGWSRAEFAAATAGWVSRGVTVCDCQGLEDYYSKADTNAKGNYANYCTDKGRISSIQRPYIYGEALFVGGSASSINHVGWIVGFAPNGEPLILHERGLSHGCVIEPLSASGKAWKWRGIMGKRYDYGEVM